MSVSPAWARDGYTRNGPRHLNCMYCGRKISSNALARSSHSRSCAARASGSPPETPPEAGGVNIATPASERRRRPSRGSGGYPSAEAARRALVQWGFWPVHTRDGIDRWGAGPGQPLRGIARVGNEFQIRDIDPEPPNEIGEYNDISTDPGDDAG